MTDNDLLALGIPSGRPVRDKHPSQALKERVAQSAIQDAEYRKLTGKKPAAASKENRPTTPQARLVESRKQITSVAVPLRQAARPLNKPRAPVIPVAAARPTPLRTPRPARHHQAQQQSMPPERENAQPPAPAQEHEQQDDVAEGSEQTVEATPSQPKERRARGTGRKLRARGGDLPARERHFVERAYPAMRALVSKDPFNTKEENEKKVSNAIIRARHSLSDDKDLVVTDDMRQLIYARMPQMYGDIKRIGSDKVAAHYGLVTSSKDVITQRNARKVAKLLDRDGFVYKDLGERLGMYQHPCISDMINTIWFSSRSKEGPLFPHIFDAGGNGIAPETLALVLTGIYSCVLQWETGSCVKVEFRESRFRGDYVDILEGLQQYKKNCPTKFRKICRDLYKAGIAHAGVVIKTRTRSGLTAEDFERAALMDTLDSDGDSSEDEEGAGNTEPRSSDDIRSITNAAADADDVSGQVVAHDFGPLLRIALRGKDARDAAQDVQGWQPIDDADEDLQDVHDDTDVGNGSPRASKRAHNYSGDELDDDSGPRPSKRRKTKATLTEHDLDEDYDERVKGVLDGTALPEDMSAEKRAAWLELSVEERLEVINDMEADEGWDLTAA